MLNLCVTFALALGKIIGFILAFEVVVASFVWAPARMAGLMPAYPGYETMGWVFASIGWLALFCGIATLAIRGSGRR